MRVTVGGLVALVLHPELWPTALRVGLGLAEPGWWRRWPPRPRLPAGYAEFRRQTMWGDRPGRLGAEELTAYLRWCRDMFSRRQ